MDGTRPDRLARSVKAQEVNWADSTGRRNTSTEGFAMGTRRRCSDGSGRGVLHSPGRPSAARREDRRRFWAAIAAGTATVAAHTATNAKRLANRRLIMSNISVFWLSEQGTLPHRGGKRAFVEIVELTADRYAVC